MKSRAFHCGPRHRKDLLSTTRQHVGKLALARKCRPGKVLEVTFRGDQNVVLPYGRELFSEPDELTVQTLERAWSKHLAEDRNGGAQAAHSNPHLVHRVPEALAHSLLVLSDLPKAGNCDQN